MKQDTDNPRFVKFDALQESASSTLPHGAGTKGASINTGDSEAANHLSSPDSVRPPASERPPKRRGKTSPLDPSGLDLNHVYSFTDLTCIEVICTGKRCGLSFIQGNGLQICPRCGGPVKLHRALWRSRRWLRTQRDLYFETNGREGMRVQAANPNAVKGEWFWDAVKRSILSKTNSQQYRRNQPCSTLHRSARTQG